MKKLILLILLLPALCFGGPIQDAHKKVIARKNATVTCTVELDLPSTKDNQGSSNFANDAGMDWAAGRFTTVGAFTCTQIEFYVDSVVGSPTGTLTAYIYSKTGATAADDEPNASLATSSNTIEAETLTGTEYIAFTFNYALSATESYWAVIYSNAQAWDNYIVLRFDSTDVERVMYGGDGGTWLNRDNTSQLYLKLSSGGCP